MWPATELQHAGIAQFLRGSRTTSETNAAQIGGEQRHIMTSLFFQTWKNFSLVLETPLLSFRGNPPLAEHSGPREKKIWVLSRSHSCSHGQLPEPLVFYPMNLEPCFLDKNTLLFLSLRHLTFTQAFSLTEKHSLPRMRLLCDLRCGL